MTLLAALVTVAFAFAGAPAGASRQPPDLVPVGVRYDLDPDPARRKTDLENMRRLRFTIVALGPGGAGQSRTLVPIDRVVAGDITAAVGIDPAGIGIVPIDKGVPAERVREAAWTLLGSGARAVVFDDWARLQQNDAALGEAAAFAETVTRNAALYAPLRPVAASGDRALTIEGGDGTVGGHWLESADALVLIAVNHADQPRDVTLTFTPAIPEAVWQNMLTGGAVNFVAGPGGPVYRRTFAARDVLVLMIRKRWK